MKLVYVAAPYRAPDSWELARNIALAEGVGLEVAKLGCVPLVPHPMTRNYGGVLPEEYWLEATLEMLRRCDAAVFAGDWERSEGCIGEWEECAARGIPSFCLSYNFTAWEEWVANGGAG